MSRKEVSSNIDFSQLKAIDLLNFIADGYYVISRNKQIVQWSRGMYDLLGLSSEEVIGLTCHQVIHKNDPAFTSHLYCPINQVLTHGSVSQVETAITDKNGREVPISATHILLENPDANILIIVEDLTSKRQLIEQQKELLAAKKIHSYFLPQAPPKNSSLDIGAAYAPANVIGGDFFNFLPARQNLGFYIGDVAGRGIPAALAVSLVSHVLRSEMPRDPDRLSSPLWALNKILCRQLGEPLFVTAIVGFYDNKEQALHFINAGHCPPLVLRSNQKKASFTSPRNLALGINESLSFKSSLVRLEKADLVVFYTDGIIESRDHNRQLFGEEKFAGIVETNRSRPAQEIADKISAAVHEFSAFIDDMTVIVIKADHPSFS